MPTAHEISVRPASGQDIEAMGRGACGRLEGELDGAERRRESFGNVREVRYRRPL
jgi:hypothetical protein